MKLTKELCEQSLKRLNCKCFSDSEICRLDRTRNNPECEDCDPNQALLIYEELIKKHFALYYKLKDYEEVYKDIRGDLYVIQHPHDNRGYNAVIYYKNGLSESHFCVGGLNYPKEKIIEFLDRAIMDKYFIDSKEKLEVFYKKLEE